MKRRGGYSGDLIYEVKVRLSPETMKKLRKLSERENYAMAVAVRQFIYRGLAALEP